MQKRIAIPFLLFGLFIFSFAEAQVKIGDNPQVIDPASILELESSDKVLVITRVDSLQMTTIVPNRGALVYNTTADCVFYYDGTQWVNMCGANGTGPSGPLTADPIVNDISTIVITPTANGDNFEVAPNSINSEQIVNGGVNGVDIQDGSIGQGKLQDNSVTQDKLSENSVGTFAIDNDNVDLGDFTNNVGFITNVSIISGDANNAISPGTDNGGAFYDDSGLQTAITANTTAIGADGDTDSGNEIQNLSFNNTSNLLSISGTAGTVDLNTLAGGSDDQNLTLTGNILEIEDGNTVDFTPILASGGTDNQNLTLTGNILEIEDGNTVDFTPILGSGGTDNQNLTLTGNILEIEDGNTVDFTPILGGGDDNQTAAEVPVTATPANYTAATQDVEAHLAGIDAALATGGGGNQNLNQVLTEGNDANASGITNLTTDGNDATAAATVGFVNAAVTAGGTLTDGSILIGGAGDAAQQLAVNGDALLDNTGLLSIQTGVIDSDNIADATIDLVDLSDMGATADGEIMQWDTGAGGWVVSPNAGHTGAANSIFFAAADGSGVPITTETSPSPNDDGGLYWDPTARFGSGSLFVGLKPTSPTGPNQRSKVVIMEEVTAGNPGAGLALPLQIQNEFAPDGGGAGVGVLFSVEATSLYGKGALAYERNQSWARGDFHFLQETNASFDNPTLADKAFTIKNNGDIRLYRGIDVDGTPTGLGTAGQVLSSTGTGVEWVAGGGGTTALNDGTIFIGDAANAPQQIALGGDVTMDNLGAVTIANAAVTDAKLDKDNIPISGFGAAAADVSLGGFKIADLLAPTLDQDAATKKYVDDNAGNNLSNSNLVQTEALRTYEVGTGQALAFIGPGDIGFGNGANPPLSKFHFAGEVRVEGVNSSQGSEGSPAYSFSTADDSNTGMYRPAADQIGFSVGGFEALRIEEPTTGSTKVVVNETLELEGQILDESNTPGTVGQVLTATATGTQWAATTNGPINVALSTFIGDGASSQLDINNSGIVTDMIEDDAVTAVKLNADVVGNGLTKNGLGALEVDTSVLIGSGTISGSEIVVTGGPNATFTNVLLEIGSGAITSAKIANGAVTDVAVSGGISGTKIIPNFGTQNIVTTGNLTVNGPVTVGGTPVHPDYVFQKYFLGISKLKEDYNFASLEEIEAFVKKHHHLPGIKSAATVKKEGTWNLSESNLQNLEKIEELYLHTINQEKEINKLKSDKETLSSELEAIKKDLEEIKSLLKKSE